MIMAFAITQLSAQTAKEKRDSSMNDSRARHLVERFEKSITQPKSDVQKKIRRTKVRKQAILWHIDNSGLKEGQKNKLRKALEKQTKSKPLQDFIAKHEDEIKAFLEETTDS